MNISENLIFSWASPAHDQSTGHEGRPPLTTRASSNRSWRRLQPALSSSTVVREDG